MDPIPHAPRIKHRVLSPDVSLTDMLASHARVSAYSPLAPSQAATTSLSVLTHAQVHSPRNKRHLQRYFPRLESPMHSPCVDERSYAWYSLGSACPRCRTSCSLAIRKGSLGLGPCPSVCLLGRGKNGAMARRIRGCFGRYICEVHGI